MFLKVQLVFENEIGHGAAVCSMQYAVCSMQYAVCSMQYAVCSTQYATYSMQYAISATRQELRNIFMNKNQFHFMF